MSVYGRISLANIFPITCPVNKLMKNIYTIKIPFFTKFFNSANFHKWHECFAELSILDLKFFFDNIDFTKM